MPYKYMNYVVDAIFITSNIAMQDLGRFFHGGDKIFREKNKHVSLLELFTEKQ